MKKYWIKSRLRKIVNFYKVNQIKTKKVKLVTRLVVIFPKTQAKLKWFLSIAPLNKMVSFIVVKSMKVVLLIERNKNLKKHGNLD